MRRKFKPFPIILLLILITGCGSTKTNLPDSSEASMKQQVMQEVEKLSEEPKTEDEAEEAASETVDAAQQDEADADIDKVEVSFDYTRMSTHASNQIAVWVEDESGQLIKTIYASGFTEARRGYENREDALNHWVMAADPAAMSDDEIDAISSATPQTGNIRFEWDLTDEAGNRVPDGRYFIKAEGALYWSSNVLYTGEIAIPGAAPGEIEVIMERSERENSDNEDMMQNVRMEVVSE